MITPGMQIVVSQSLLLCRDKFDYKSKRATFGDHCVLYWLCNSLVNIFCEYIWKNDKFLTFLGIYCIKDENNTRFKLCDVLFLDSEIYDFEISQFSYLIVSSFYILLMNDLSNKYNLIKYEKLHIVLFIIFGILFGNIINVIY